MFMYIGMKELSYAACQVLTSQGDVSTVPFWDNLLINVIIEEFTANLYNVFWRALEGLLGMQIMEDYHHFYVNLFALI